MQSKSQASHSKDRIDRLRNQPVDGLSLKKLIEAGLTWLRTNQQTVNALNVFPVPDGDTGTNMVLTMQAAFDEIRNLPTRNFGKMVHTVAHGALMGARGNSGVILSQLWRGFARSVDDQEILDADSFVTALAVGRDTAYKGVVRPVEGTILTVAKDIASSAQITLGRTHDLIEILESIVQAGDESVERTPQLLPILKEAGVVDAGGKGLFFILEGMLRFIQGKSLEVPHTTVKPLSAINIEHTLSAIEPGQDFEVVVDFFPKEELDLIGFYEDLEKMGTSIQLGEGDGLYRLHIHVETDKRYEPINYTMSLGTISKVSMENLIEQVEEKKAEHKISQLTLAKVEPGQIAVVTVVPGDGIARVFASLGVSAIIEGGQTMNPSTQEILNSFENLPTDKVIILPNNKNIIGAANSAAELTVKKVAVIPCQSIPQGLAAMMRLAPSGDFDEVVKDMSAAMDEVETGEITQATRDVEIDGVKVKEGEYIALHNGKLVYASSDLKDTCLGLLSNAHADHFELITLFSGMDVPKTDVNLYADAIRKAYPDQEVEVQEGGQPHYFFILSIE
jgi:DAK2 domain fusion protein YloV